MGAVGFQVCQEALAKHPVIFCILLNLLLITCVKINFGSELSPSAGSSPSPPAWSQSSGTSPDVTGLGEVTSSCRKGLFPGSVQISSPSGQATLHGHADTHSKAVTYPQTHTHAHAGTAILTRTPVSNTPTLPSSHADFIDHGRTHTHICPPADPCTHTQAHSCSSRARAKALAAGTEAPWRGEVQGQRARA